jgi:hypothetical protein
MISLIVVLAGVAAAAEPMPAEPALRAELVKRMAAEQGVRQELSTRLPGAKFFDPEARKKPEVKAAFEKMATIDGDNLKWFKEVVGRHGWPGRSLVGRDGAQAAFLIAQHAVADPAFQTKCLDLLRAANNKGEVEGQHVALLTDRLRVLVEKKKQLYGSQLKAENGKLVPLPIEDEANVDRRRKELGMPPLAEYLKFVNRPETGPAKKD